MLLQSLYSSHEGLSLEAISKSVVSFAHSLLDRKVCFLYIKTGLINVQAFGEAWSFRKLWAYQLWIRVCNIKKTSKKVDYIYEKFSR